MAVKPLRAGMTNLCMKSWVKISGSRKLSLPDKRSLLSGMFHAGKAAGPPPVKRARKVPSPKVGPGAKPPQNPVEEEKEVLPKGVAEEVVPHENRGVMKDLPTSSWPSRMKEIQGGSPAAAVTALMTEGAVPVQAAAPGILVVDMARIALAEAVTVVRMVVDMEGAATVGADMVAEAMVVAGMVGAATVGAGMVAEAMVVAGMAGAVTVEAVMVAPMVEVMVGGIELLPASCGHRSA